jgi:hypothetical protein
VVKPCYPLARRCIGFRYGNGKVGANAEEARDPSKGSAVVQDKWHTRSDACGRPEPHEGMNGALSNFAERGRRGSGRVSGTQKFY